MKYMKATDTVILTLALTAKEARVIRDFVFSDVANADSIDASKGWEYPADMSFGEYLRHAEEKKRAPALKKLYHALRSALRMPRKKGEDFFDAYDGPRASDSKAFEVWVEGLGDVFSLPPRMECERSELQHVVELIERATRILGLPGSGAVFRKNMWCWQGQRYDDWESLKEALLESFNNDTWRWMGPVDKAKWNVPEEIIDDLLNRD